MKLIFTVVIAILYINVFNINKRLCSNYTSDSNIKITIKGIRSDKGKIVVAVFKDQESFKARKPIKRLEIKKSDLNDSEIALDLANGIYGISVLDDENSNNKMDYNFFGIPKEGFGFSDYYHQGLSKPNFSKFKFEINNREIKIIEIRLRYM